MNRLLQIMAVLCVLTSCGSDGSGVEQPGEPSCKPMGAYTLTVTVRPGSTCSAEGTAVFDVDVTSDYSTARDEDGCVIRLSQQACSQTLEMECLDGTTALVMRACNPGATVCTGDAHVSAPDGSCYSNLALIYEKR